MNFFGIGGLEIVVIAGLAFFLLGPKKMIETSRSAGKVIRELRTERDKFTRMVMQEYDVDEDDGPSPASRPSRAAASVSDEDDDSAPDDGGPEGSVSRPRGGATGTATLEGPEAPDEPARE